jgi:hypothetical protein
LFFSSAEQFKANKSVQGGVDKKIFFFYFLKSASQLTAAASALLHSLAVNFSSCSKPGVNKIISLGSTIRLVKQERQNVQR